MLTQESAATVRATLPVVGGAIGEIAALFYTRMFEDHPELRRDLFNRGNQASGEQQQVLAGAIAAFAGMLVEHPDVRPDAMLARIAHKHASLGITPEQYNVVHKYLFGAIAEVLGEAVTPDVAAAWDEVYWLMANALIALEARLYQEAGVGLGEVWHRATVVCRIQESAEAVSFGLRFADGSPLPGFRPGQYLSVAVTLPDGARQIRQYSLSRYSLPEGPGRDLWRITVKRVRGAAGPDGEVSNHLHGRVREGDELCVSLPFGDLALDDSDAPLLLASAGIGCTPMLGMLTHLADRGTDRAVTVLHADRSAGDHAHRAETRALVAQLPDAALHLWYEDGVDGRTGHVDLADIDLPTGVRAYLCGPLPFMRHLRGALLARGVPAGAIHYEVFGPDLWQAHG
ncbi:globin domain-containing protein [Kitasatospora mediocidica]|uniref:globin domain-containing protein n=1 Tax=Kitasatospora mediocidica TaxID=58352 RepID=UPI00055E910D|nr:globin domain-containing protein [Kitasatospora mediocidica]